MFLVIGPPGTGRRGVGRLRSSQWAGNAWGRGNLVGRWELTWQAVTTGRARGEGAGSTLLGTTRQASRRHAGGGFPRYGPRGTVRRRSPCWTGQPRRAGRFPARRG